MSKSETRFYESEDGVLAVTARKRGVRYWKFREMSIEEYWRRTHRAGRGLDSPREYQDCGLQKGPLPKEIRGPLGHLPQ